MYDSRFLALNNPHILVEKAHYWASIVNLLAVLRLFASIARHGLQEMEMPTPRQSPALFPSVVYFTHAPELALFPAALELGRNCAMLSLPEMFWCVYTTFSMDIVA